MTSALCETVVGGVRKLAAAETAEDGGELGDTQSYRLCTEAVGGVTGLPGGWPGADRQQPDGECDMARGDRGIGRVASLCLANKGHKVCIGIGYREREDCAHEVVEKIRHFGGTAIAVGCDQPIAEQAQADREFQSTHPRGVRLVALPEPLADVQNPVL